jgi:hypothetical protein
VVNPNVYPITVYLDSVNFLANDETGRPTFIPVISNETKGETLAEWIVLSDGAIVIAAGQSAVIPFTVIVPSEAAPGGHYAAITIGTRPPELLLTDTSQVTTSQVLTALVFLKVDGNIVESAAIREFRSDKSVVQSSKNSFVLRVQNSGNVHVQPQGEITIYNMWGAKRGTIPINQQTQYGIVLKDSIREYTFAWDSDSHPFDIGRYKAVVALAYGEETRQFINSATYFWVFPYTIVAVATLVLFGFAYFVSFLIKLYIRRVLSMAGIDPDTVASGPVRIVHRNQKGDLVLRPKPTHAVVNELAESTNFSRRGIIAIMLALLAPITQFCRDTWQLIFKISNVEELRIRIILFLQTYKFALIAILVIVTMAVLIGWFRSVVQGPVGYYEVTVIDGADSKKLSSEALAYDSLPVYIVETPFVFPEQLSTVSLVNASGQVGLAAALNRVLDGHGIIVNSLTADPNRSDRRTVIVYSRNVAEEAVALSRFLNNAPLSVRDGEEDNEITIFVGQDYQPSQ